MNIHLKPEDQAYLEEQVRSGRYTSTDDALAEAIERLRCSDDVPPSEEDLSAVRAGLEQLSRGEGLIWNDVRDGLQNRRGLSG